jgi:site-specific DNA-methyltransferase (adenine-specific)
VTKDGGAAVWIVADATVKGSETGTSFRQALFAIECGFKLHDTMIWCKDTTPFHMSNRYYQAFEYMFVFTKGPPKTFNQICDKKNKYAGSSVHGTLRKEDGSVKLHSSTQRGEAKKIKDFGSRLNYWLQPTEKNSKANGHPAVFPVALAQDHVISWSNPGDTVLDPFLGSGTTGVACVNTGRNFIGIERDPDYFKIAQDRISQAQTVANNATGGDLFA